MYGIYGKNYYREGGDKENSVGRRIRLQRVINVLFIFFNPRAHHQSQTRNEYTEVRLTAFSKANDRISSAWQIYARHMVGFALIVRR